MQKLKYTAAFPGIGWSHMRLATLFFLLSLLTACGQKGPLYLPGTSESQDQVTSEDPDTDTQPDPQQVTLSAKKPQGK